MFEGGGRSGFVDLPTGLFSISKASHENDMTRIEIEAELVELFGLPEIGQSLSDNIDRAIALHRLSPVALTAALLTGMVNVPEPVAPVEEASHDDADQDSSMVVPEPPVVEAPVQHEAIDSVGVVDEPIVAVVAEPEAVVSPETTVDPVVVAETDAPAIEQEPAPVVQPSEPVAAVEEVAAPTVPEPEPPKPMTEADMIRALLVENPSLTNGQVMDQLALANVNVTSTQIKAVRSRL